MNLSFLSQGNDGINGWILLFAIVVLWALVYMAGNEEKPEAKDQSLLSKFFRYPIRRVEEKPEAKDQSLLSKFFRYRIRRVGVYTPAQNLVMGCVGVLIVIIIFIYLVLSVIGEVFGHAADFLSHLH